jgi:hypothetical protein
MKELNGFILVYIMPLSGSLFLASPPACTIEIMISIACTFASQISSTELNKFKYSNLDSYDRTFGDVETFRETVGPTNVHFNTHIMSVFLTSLYYNRKIILNNVELKSFVRLFKNKV